MSMLSAQCDELRKMADQLQKRGTFNPLMRGAATAMREAADTICHLRNQLNDLQTENASLREFAKDTCTVLRGFYKPEWFDETVFTERMRELGIEVPE